AAAFAALGRDRADWPCDWSGAPTVRTNAGRATLKRMRIEPSSETGATACPGSAGQFARVLFRHFLDRLHEAAAMDLPPAKTIRQLEHTNNLDELNIWLEHRPCREVRFD